MRVMNSKDYSILFLFLYNLASLRAFTLQGRKNVIVKNISVESRRYRSTIGGLQMSSSPYPSTPPPIQPSPPTESIEEATTPITTKAGSKAKGTKKVSLRRYLDSLVRKNPEVCISFHWIYNMP